ncbi:hypothetical protein ACLFLN_17930 [Acinetobacter pittii]
MTTLEVDEIILAMHEIALQFSQIAQRLYPDQIRESTLEMIQSRIQQNIDFLTERLKRKYKLSANHQLIVSRYIICRTCELARFIITNIRWITAKIRSASVKSLHPDRKSLRKNYHKKKVCTMDRYRPNSG